MLIIVYHMREQLLNVSFRGIRAAHYMYGARAGDPL